MLDSLHVSCLYCEDVRVEARDGKLTLVGVYPPGATVPLPSSLPAVMRRLCIVGSLVTSDVEHFQQIRGELRLDDKVLHTANIPIATPTRPSEPMAEQPGQAIQVVMEFNNLSLPAAGTLHLVMIVNEQELCCPGLRLREPQVKPAVDARARKPA